MSQCSLAIHKGFLRISYGKAVQIKGAQCDGKGECIEECPRMRLRWFQSILDNMQLIKLLKGYIL